MGTKMIVITPNIRFEDYKIYQESNKTISKPKQNFEIDAINLFSQKLNKADDKGNQATVGVITYPWDRSS